MDPQDIVPRLERVETKLAFLEDFLLQLQEETLVRKAALDRLETGQQALKTRLLQLAQNMEELPHQRPPHY